jgi:hypothetical protein
MAGNLLWAHLLRKDAATTDPPSQIPPIAPQDKTGTSMRMLIHDTQANLEKFSTRLDGLLQRVDDCRAQVVNATQLLDVERDRVLTEMREIGTEGDVRLGAVLTCRCSCSAQMPGGDQGARRDPRASARPRSRPRRTGLDGEVRAGVGKAHRRPPSGSCAAPGRRCTDGSA